MNMSYVVVCAIEQPTDHLYYGTAVPLGHPSSHDGDYKVWV